MQDPHSLTMLAPAAPLTPAERRRSLVAVIACITVVGMALGVSIPLLALLMERADVSASVIGLNTAMPALATFVFTPFIPNLLRRVSANGFLLVCILVSALAMPAYYAFPNVWLWFPIRFINGLALTGLFVVSEFWINTLADEKNRGRLIGIYGTVLSGNILFQIPIGMWADRADRRLVLLVCALTGLVGILAIPFVTHSLVLFAPTLFIFGGVVVGLYTVGLTLLGERFKGADLASANAAFVMMYSIGALVGPPLSGAAMDLWDPHGLILSMAGLCGLYVLVAGWRYLTAPRTVRPASRE